MVQIAKFDKQLHQTAALCSSIAGIVELKEVHSIHTDSVFPGDYSLVKQHLSHTIGQRDPLSLLIQAATQYQVLHHVPLAVNTLKVCLRFNR